eukprot:4912504-Amphidinium_carterae.1
MVPQFEVLLAVIDRQRSLEVSLSWNQIVSMLEAFALVRIRVAELDAPVLAQPTAMPTRTMMHITHPYIT